MRPIVYRWLSEFTRRNTLIAILVALVAAAAAVWAFINVQTAVREARRTYLGGLLDTQAELIDFWISARKYDARQWAGDEELRRLVRELIARSRSGPAATKRRLHGELLKRLAPALEDGNLALANIVAPDGILLASLVPEYTGRRLAPAFRERLARVFRGEQVFIGPMFEAERLPGPGVANPDTAIVWAAAPLRDESGRVVAVLCLGRHAGKGFAHRLEITRPGATGEAYVFDRDGRMMSNSRFEDRLKAGGLLAPGQTALGRVMVRPPDGDQGIHAATARPTELAARALQAAAAPGGERKGILLTPYRNYAGDSVIGAWQWLDEHQLGLAVEIGEAEAYKTIAILNTQLGVMVLTLAVAVFLGPMLPGILWRRVVPVKRGQSVGAYRLERKIGEGGMAEVFLGTHERLGRPAAVKIVKGGQREEIQQRFEREARLLASLSHTDIAAVYEIGNIEDGRPYYAMEYFDGEPLDRIVARDGPMEEGLACEVLIRLCGILQHACDRGVLHRDVKPENLLLARDAQGEVSLKLIDFGLAKALDPALHDQLTREVSLLGTLGYLAPERIRDPADADIRGEVYGVGAIGYFLLTGQEWLPNLESAAPEEAPPIGARRTLETPGLEAVIAKALRHRKSARWENCRELAAALESCRSKTPG
ncbi:MAG: serine/threonine protein kinase [Denitratisoma sp.]|nr:serine/threonine protein kinase [Denitratisoma sp.]